MAVYLYKFVIQIGKGIHLMKLWKLLEAYGEDCMICMQCYEQYQYFKLGWISIGDETPGLPSPIDDVCVEGMHTMVQEVRWLIIREITEEVGSSKVCAIRLWQKNSTYIVLLQYYSVVGKKKVFKSVKMPKQKQSSQ